VSSVDADLGRVHFVGIGGAGMSGIARIMLTRGMQVSGSDAKDSAVLTALRALGATVYIGHSAQHVAAADTVVVSNAIRPGNPELAAARAADLRVLPRAGALAWVMRGYRGVAVAGTAGKTTTTSMLTVAAQRCGADPSFAIGGELNESGSNAHHGSGELFVVEADESDGSFLLLSPYAAIVTNVEPDHLDQHGTAAAYVAAFDDFVGCIDASGILVAGVDDAGARRVAVLARDRGLRTRTYGVAPDSDLRLESVAVRRDGTTYRAVVDGAFIGPVEVSVTGHHMALNSAAALLAGMELGLPSGQLLEGLRAYRGVHRRFELKGRAGGVTVYDDYAHHPTKVRAQLHAARVVAGQGRLIVAFQPHLFSRTKAFAAEFGAALGLADEVVVMEIAGVREDPLPGVTGALVAGAVTLPPEHVHYEPSWTAVAPLVTRLARPGDLVITMGAGDVTMLGAEVLAELEATAS